MTLGEETLVDMETAMKVRSLVVGVVVFASLLTVSGQAEAQGQYEVAASEFGAKCDGATDDGPALNAALASLPAGGLLRIPAGTCMTSQTLTASAFTTIAGYGWSSVLKALPGMSGYFIAILGKDRVTVRDLKIDSSFPNVARYCVAIGAGSNYALVQNVWTTQCHYGIAVIDKGRAGGAAGHIIRGNLVDLTGTPLRFFPIGIEVFPKGGTGYLASPGIIIEGNTIVGDSNSLDGIKVNAQNGCRISNNYVTGVTSPSSEASINVVSSRGCVISGNAVYQAKSAYSASGIPGENGIRSDYHTWVANTAREFTFAAFIAMAGSTGHVFGYNVVESGNGGGRFGFYFSPTADANGFDRLTIMGNTLNGVGIALIPDGAKRFPNTRILDNGIFGAPANGIQVDGDDVQVNNNFVAGAGRRCVYVYGQHPQVNNNKVHDCAAGTPIDVHGDGGTAQVLNNQLR
jgi:Pectate lyase superfamily protein